MNTGKTLNRLTPEATINQIISVEANAANLLSSIGMKPELYQDQTLRSVCRQHQWNEEELLKWIKKNNTHKRCLKNEKEPSDFGDDINGWCVYLSETAQPCIREIINDITRDFPRVQLVHGNQYTWLKNIDWHFNDMKEQLGLYMSLEEKTLFPLTAELNDRKESILYGKVIDLNRSLDILETDRPKIIKKIEVLRSESGYFTPPEGACSTLRIMIKNMEDLTMQLKKYFAVEQGQLFPLIKEQLQST